MNELSLQNNRYDKFWIQAWIAIKTKETCTATANQLEIDSQHCSPDIWCLSSTYACVVGCMHKSNIL